MLGPSLLVAPVFAEDGVVEHFIPAGRWTHFVTGRTVKGPIWLRERYDVLSLPLFVRPGTVVPVGAHEDCPDYDYADGVTLRVYDLADGAHVSVDVPDLHGQTAASFTVTRAMGIVTVERLVGTKPWRLLLVNVKTHPSVVGGTAETTPDGTFVTPDADAARVEIAVG